MKYLVILLIIKFLLCGLSLSQETNGSIGNTSSILDSSWQLSATDTSNREDSTLDVQPTTEDSVGRTTNDGITPRTEDSAITTTTSVTTTKEDSTLIITTTSEAIETTEDPLPIFEETCFQPKGCTYADPFGILTFPKGDAENSFKHDITSEKSESVVFFLLDMKNIILKDTDILKIHDSWNDELFVIMANVTDQVLNFTFQNSISLTFEGTKDRAAFKIPYRKFDLQKTVGWTKCTEVSGCLYTEPSDWLTFPVTPSNENFVHSISLSSSLVYLTIDPDLIDLKSEGDKLVIAKGREQTPGSSASEEILLTLTGPKKLPQKKVFTISSGLVTVRYTSNSSESDFFIFYKSVKKDWRRITQHTTDVRAFYQPNTMVVWTFEPAASYDAEISSPRIEISIRGALLDQKAGDYVLVGPGSNKEVLKSSQAAFLASPISKGDKLTFSMKEETAYVVFYMGTRTSHFLKRGLQEILYIEYKAEGLGSNITTTTAAPFREEGIVLCVETENFTDIDGDTWKTTEKTRIQQRFANAANEYVKFKNLGIKEVKYFQVVIPENNTILFGEVNSKAKRVLLVSIVEDDNITVLFKRNIVQEIYDFAARNSKTYWNFNVFTLTTDCSIPSTYLFALIVSSVCLALSISLFLVVWRWKTKEYWELRIRKKIDVDEEAKKFHIEIPQQVDQSRVNPAFIPDSPVSFDRQFCYPSISEENVVQDWDNAVAGDEDPSNYALATFPKTEETERESSPGVKRKISKKRKTTVKFRAEEDNFVVGIPSTSSSGLNTRSNDEDEDSAL